MSNIRIYELSKELNLSNKEVIQIAQGLGISVKSHASSISDEEAKQIKSKINGSNGADASAEDNAQESKEKVRVFKEESGAEVVERRKGGRVVLRRKKKAEEPPPPPEEEPVVEKEVVVEPAETVEELKPETKVDEVAEKPGAEQPAMEAQAEGEQVELEAAPEIEPEVVVDEVPDLEQPAQEARKTGKAEPPEGEEEAKKKTKKKAKKAKPKKEEIIDEDSLEELRKAFRTKLPGKKREYLVEEKRARSRGGPGMPRRDKGGEKTLREVTRAPVSLSSTEAASDVIPFPAKPQKRSIKIGEAINVGELAKLMSIKAGELIKKLIALGVRATINQSLDHETATLVAEEFGFEVTLDIFEEEEILLEQEADEEDAVLELRPPVVTVMGHVDHGKTTLLDSIRESNVVEGEAGGITQHIGAYSVSTDGRKISFIDTPGHEAFTAMRARGARVTDVVILVVAADDGVMPQTLEAVNHAKAAEVPLIVAVNKIDKAEADKDKILRQLSEIGLLSEEWGGDTMFADVSAKEKTGIKELLELVILQADVLELKANYNKRANGFVIESELDKGRGPVATLIVSDGTLKIGDFVVAGMTYGKVRALNDDKGKRVKEAGPSMPVEIMGLSGVPEAGERFYVVKDEKAAKEVIGHRETKEREKVIAAERKPSLSLENLFENLESETAKELAIIIKADTQGSVEAVRDSLEKLPTDKCQIKIVHTGVGSISETDINLASASNALIVGFNVRPDSKTVDLSEKEGVSLELHTIIYNLIDRVRNAMEGLLEPIVKEKPLGHAEVRETFHISRLGTIAGCMVTDGKVTRDSNVRVVRDGVQIYEGKLSSLKRFQDDAKEVQTGFECGIGIEKYNDIKVGDTFEFYTHEEFKQEL